jgi:hypothetical protein
MSTSSSSSPGLSAGARFACWFAAYADGRTSLDEALDAITGEDAAHHLVGLDDGDATPLALGLGRLRARGVEYVALALPAPGDPCGLAGPAGFNAEPPPPDLGEADRGLRAVLREAAELLADLDVAAWQPEVADALLNLRRADGPSLPPGMEPRAVALATTAARCRAIVDLARQTDGGALTAAQADARTASMRPLDRAARRALAAACSAPVAR